MIPLTRTPAAILYTVLGFSLAACSSSQAAPPTPTVIAAKLTPPQLVVASSDLAIGRNRFTFGILDNNRPVSSGHPRVTFFTLHGNAATAEQTTSAAFNYFARGLPRTPYNSAAVEIGGVYVTYAHFRQAGTWGIEVDMPYHGRPLALRAQFSVVRHSTSPAVGSPAPRSNNPTIADLPATRLDSARPPDTMHTVRISTALKQHHPLLVLFATAAFCTSRMCGPEIEVVKQLKARYGKQMDFVHIEIYKDANPAHGVAPAFTQWGLKTEPWVFVVDRHGIVVAKFEGPTPGSEIEPSIRAALG